MSKYPCYIHCLREISIYFGKYPTLDDIHKKCESVTLEKGTVEYIILSLKRLSLFATWHSGKIDINKSKAYILSNGKVWIGVYLSPDKSSPGMLNFIVSKNGVNTLGEFNNVRAYLKENGYVNGVCIIDKI